MLLEILGRLVRLGIILPPLLTSSSGLKAATTAPVLLTVSPSVGLRALGPGLSRMAKLPVEALAVLVVLSAVVLADVVSSVVESVELLYVVREVVT